MEAAEATERWEHLRKWTAGMAMLAAPVLFIITWVIHPQLKTDEADQLAEYAGASARGEIAIALDVVTLALVAFATLGLVHLLRDRAPTLGNIAGGLVITGVIFNAASDGVYAAGVELAKAGVTDANVAVYEDMFGSALFWVAGIGYTILGIGMLALSYGLYRARVVPEPSAILLAVFVVGQFIGFAFGIMPLVVASGFVFFIALAPVGVHVITESDEEWEHSPQFHMYKATPA